MSDTEGKNIVHFKPRDTLEGEAAAADQKEINRQIVNSLLYLLDKAEKGEITTLCLFADVMGENSIRTVVTPDLWLDAVAMIGFTELVKDQIMLRIREAAFIEEIERPKDYDPDPEIGPENDE